MRFFKSRLARQLMIRVILILVAIASILIASEFYLVYRLQLENQRQSIEQMMVNMRPILSRSLWSFDTLNLNFLSETLMRNPHVDGVLITDDSNQEINSKGNTTALQQQAFDQEGLQRQDNHLVYHSRIFYDDIHMQNKLVGYVTLSVTDDEIWAGLKPALTVQSTAGLIALALMGLLFYQMLNRSVSTPINKLSDSLARYQIDARDIALIRNTLKDNELSDLLDQYHHLLGRLKERDEQIRLHHKNLETEVHQRTEELVVANNYLMESLAKLQLAQRELIEQERMASLGELVSGVAHEVNTPLGVAITANSFLWEEVQQIARKLDTNELTRSEMDAFMNSADESCQIMSVNLKRAAELIESFKQVAVDQTYEELRIVQMSSYIESVVRSLRPQMRRTQVTIKLDLEESLSVTTYPGAIAQLLTNLIMNAYIHGYDQGQVAGDIIVSCHQINDLIQLQVRDFGKGMDSSTKTKLYEPFFTTRRAQGGTGLGMNIVYNLVSQKLRGKIEVKTEPDKGTAFLVTFRSQPETLTNQIEITG